MEDKNGISDNLVVHCPTEDVAREVLKCLNNLGYTWYNKDKYCPDHNHWEVYKGTTCYHIKQGVYGRLGDFRGLLIISGEEFLKKYATTNSTLRLKKLERIKLKFTL